MVVEDGILYRNFYEHTGKVSNKQYCVPEQLKKEVVYRLHNSRTAGHLGIVRTAHEFRQRFYRNQIYKMCDIVTNISFIPECKGLDVDWRVFSNQ